MLGEMIVGARTALGWVNMPQGHLIAALSGSGSAISGVKERATADRRVHEPYVFAAILIALTAGFGYATILVEAIAHKVPLGAWWIALGQAHGHAQLFGWAGLFVLGVGLYFLPRLRGTTLMYPQLAPYALVCYCIGIALRALSQPFGAIADTSMPPGQSIAALGLAGIAFSGIFELAGTALIIAMFAITFRHAGPVGSQAPIVPVRPYLITALVSLSLATILNTILGIYGAISSSFIFPSTWNDLLVHLMIFGFIIPIVISLSVRNLPLFMRLAMPPRGELMPLFLIFVTGLILQLTALLAHLFAADLALLTRLGALGSILEYAAIIAFVWMLDVLLRRKPAWIVNRATQPAGYVETRKPTRKNYPDYGEFGRFELLVISAYAWLVIAASVGVINGIAALLTGSTIFNPDIERHAITVGFITLLIFGMAVRMLPGFSGKSRIASTRLVMATFWFGNLAAISRVLPLFAPQAPGAEIAFGASGAIGWIAVACLGVNLWRTAKTIDGRRKTDDG
jgi:uncharacterized protein involved in response to NO